MNAGPFVQGSYQHARQRVRAVLEAAAMICEGQLDYGQAIGLLEVAFPLYQQGPKMALHQEAFRAAFLHGCLAEMVEGGRLKIAVCAEDEERASSYFQLST
jgi:hypothetical protein